MFSDFKGSKTVFFDDGDALSEGAAGDLSIKLMVEMSVIIDVVGTPGFG